MIAAGKKRPMVTPPTEACLKKPKTKQGVSFAAQENTLADYVSTADLTVKGRLIRWGSQRTR